jgi:integrase
VKEKSHSVLLPLESVGSLVEGLYSRSCDVVYPDMIAVMILTGALPHELVRLREVDYDSGQLWIDCSGRRLPVPDSAVLVLDGHAQGKAGGDRVFTTAEGDAVSQRRLLTETGWAAVCAAIGQADLGLADLKDVTSLMYLRGGASVISVDRLRGGRCAEADTRLVDRQLQKAAMWVDQPAVCPGLAGVIETAVQARFAPVIASGASRDTRSGGDKRAASDYGSGGE